MPTIRLYRARVDFGSTVRGHVFSFNPIAEVNTQVDDQQLRLWQQERFYVQTPSGYTPEVVDGRRMVRDPHEGDNVYMEAARVMSRVWQGNAGFHIIPSYEYDELDQRFGPEA